MNPDFDRPFEIAKSDAVTRLDISMFKVEDAVNFILQRSDVLSDQSHSGRITKAWSEGNSKPILDVAQSKGEDMIRRAIAFILLEFEELKPLLTKLPKDKVADIGCGYAVFDYFMARDFGSHVSLIDLEATDNRHFGFEDKGAAYSNLDRARQFLVANGVAQSQIATLNPNAVDVTDLRDIDIAVSFLSCGFHYPWQIYEAFFKTSVKPTGSIILDIRTRNSAAARTDLALLGKVTSQGKLARGRADRLWIEKTA
ncbi:hypothetical protein N9M66_02905 [Litoreibacter sp.]|nr:hypothetical protein [Litoreibacter sp.]